MPSPTRTVALKTTCQRQERRDEWLRGYSKARAILAFTLVC